MKITDIKTQLITIPLTRTFKTALRSVDTLENILVTIETDSALVGYGSAAPTAVITGETVGSISAAIEHIRNIITGMYINNHEQIFQRLNNCIIGNNSAKAAVDMGIYDLLAKSLNIPLFRLLGGFSDEIESDITISLDSIDKMTADSREKIKEGFKILKIKVGGNPQDDIDRLHEIHKAIEGKGLLRIDANQGWTGKEAVMVGKEIERRRLPVELMEQPVAAKQFTDLAFVKQNVSLPVYADESIFSPADALELIQMNAIDGINIKLMKCGGIYNGLKIAAIADAAGIPCMIGSMMECSVSVTAAAHLGASRTIIKGYDLDAPLFCSRNPARGGISYQGPKVILPETAGLGITSITT